LEVLERRDKSSFNPLKFLGLKMKEASGQKGSKRQVMSVRYQRPGALGMQSNFGQKFKGGK